MQCFSVLSSLTEQQYRFLLLLFVAQVLSRARDLGGGDRFKDQTGCSTFHLTHTGLSAPPYRTDAQDLAKATQKLKWQRLSLHLGLGLNSVLLVYLPGPMDTAQELGETYPCTPWAGFRL